MAIPEKSRIPFIYVDFDNSRAISTSTTQTYNVLLIGQKLKASKGASLQPISVRSEKEVADLFGLGSMLHHMAKAYFQNNNTSKTYAIAVDDPEEKSGTQATWQIKIEGEIKDSRSIPLFIAGTKVEVVTGIGKKPADIYEDLAELINKNTSLPVIAEPKPEALTLKSKHSGQQAGKIDVRKELGSIKQYSEIDLKIERLEGTGSIPLTSLINNIKDKQFHIIVNPYTDKENLTSLAQDLESRFSPLRQIEGHLISACDGNSKTIKDSDSSIPSSQHMTILSVGEGSPTPAYVWASALAGVIAFHGQIDPARPFYSLPIYGCMPSEDKNRFERSTRSDLLDQGFSTYSVDFSDLPRVESLITRYKNPNSDSDTSYLCLETLLTLSFLRYSFVNYFFSKYPRHKLADDGVIIRPGSAILTPNTARCETIALFKAWEEAGLVSGFDQFKSDLFVERNKKDRTRLDFYMSPRLVSQLKIIGANISFLI